MRLIDANDTRLTEYERHVLANAADRLQIEPAPPVLDPETGRARGFLVLLADEP